MRGPLPELKNTIYIYISIFEGMEIGDDDSVPSAQMVQISVGFGRRRIIPESFATGFGSAAAALADHLVLNVKEGIA